MLKVLVTAPTPAESGSENDDDGSNYGRKEIMMAVTDWQMVDNVKDETVMVMEQCDHLNGSKW